MNKKDTIETAKGIGEVAARRHNYNMLSGKVNELWQLKATYGVIVRNLESGKCSAEENKEAVETETKILHLLEDMVAKEGFAIDCIGMYNLIGKELPDRDSVDDDNNPDPDDKYKAAKKEIERLKAENKDLRQKMTESDLSWTDMYRKNGDLRKKLAVQDRYRKHWKEKYEKLLKETEQRDAKVA